MRIVFDGQHIAVALPFFNDGIVDGDNSRWYVCKRSRQFFDVFLLKVQFVAFFSLSSAYSFVSERLRVHYGAFDVHRMTAGVVKISVVLWASRVWLFMLDLVVSHLS